MEDDDRYMLNLLFHVFIQFLAQEKALDRYLTEVEKNLLAYDLSDHYRFDNMGENSMRGIIMCSFVLNETREGSEYWYEISDKWKYHVYPQLIEKIKELTA